MRYILLNLHQKKLEETISWCLTVTWKVSFHKILSSISLVSNIGKMSSGEVRKVSREDIQVVQNLIERCLQLYMNQKEVVNTLLVRAKIEPGFTELVWKKLEEENQEFFKAYYLRLIVKEQIMEFNRLLERQVQLMRQICPAEVASLPMSNGSHIQQVQQDSACYAPDLSGLTLKAQSMSQPIGSSLPHTYLQNAIDMSGHATSIDVLPNTVSNVGMMRGTNGGMVKPEAGYLESSQYMFGNDGNVLLGCPANGDASVSSFGSVGSHSQPFYESLLGANGAFGHLGPRNFSFSDLTVDMANYADILGNYSRSPFVAPDTNFFLDPHGRGQHQGANPPPC